MLVVASPSIADEVVSLGVERGNVQVNKVVKTTPLGGSAIEYTKTRIEMAPKPVVVSKEPRVRKQLAQVQEKPSLLKQDQSQAELPTFNFNALTPTSNEFAALSLPNAEQKGLVVKTKDDIQSQAEREKKLNAIQQQKKQADRLKLVPGEELIKAKKEAKEKQRLRKKVKGPAEQAIISKLEFTRANILDVTRALADISGLNFVATDKAAKKSVTVFLQNTSVIDALETITKNSGLWYRKDKKSGTYRIMSTDEYARDLIVYREDVTRVFKLLHPNPTLIARTIQDLYGKRVALSLGAFDETTMPELSSGGGSSGVGRSNNSRGRSGNNRGGSSSSNGSGRSGQNYQTLNEAKQTFSKQATASQLEALSGDAKAIGNQDAVGVDKLGAITTNEQPIYVALNREQDLMIVRTSDVAVMKDIEALVKQLDLPTKQVLLEMKILSLDIGDFYRRATDLDFMPSNDTVRGPLTDQAKNPLGTIAPINVDSTTTVGGTTQTQSGVINLGVSHILGLGNFALEGGTFVYQFLSDKIRARIQLLQQNNRINTLSSPILLTTNKKPARVFVGTEQIVTTGFEAIAGGSNGLVAGNPAIIPITEIRDIGNTLQVMPHINGDKTVTLLIKQDASSLIRGGSTIPIPVGNTVQSFNVDSVRTSNIQGTVVAKDGLTIAIGGLIDASDSEDIQKVPVLGDFPIIGEFFKRTVKEKSKRELILLITPHIIESPHMADDISRDVVEPLTEHEW